MVINVSARVKEGSDEKKLSGLVTGIPVWNHTVDMMDKRRIECLAVVLDNSDFVESWRRSLDWDDESEDANVDDITNASDADCIKNEKNGAWWKLESSDSKATSITIVLKTVGGSMFDIFCD
ncbi:hypothetical protein WN944_029254 [Citrus x changshan-huyou]|uniref:Uncharacterized protein n=1 Tax=Citrus x changshan-huyou TaxID=2935761 RepID=A0AAP0LPA3_9ROSI